MKKHLSLLFILLISACAGPTTSSLTEFSEPSISSSSSEVISSEISSSSSIKTDTQSSYISSSKEVSSSLNTVSSSEEKSSSLVSSSSEVSSSLNSSSSAVSSSSAMSSSEAQSSSSSISSSSASSSVGSSSSSSSSTSNKPTSKEILDAFHSSIEEKRNIIEDENYIKQTLLGDNILANHYYGKFAEQPDDGYIFIDNQGLFHYEIINDEVVIGDCKSIDPKTKICDYFLTSYDLKDLKKYWKEGIEDYTYFCNNSSVGELIAELDGQGILSYAAISYQNTLTINPEDLSAKYECVLKTDEYGTFFLSFTLRAVEEDLPNEPINFLESHPDGLTSLNDFPEDIKEAIKNVTGLEINGPTNASYAHESYFTETVAFYEDYLVGDKVLSYREYIKSLGFILSDITDEVGDMKKYGYVRYYYEMLAKDLVSTIFVEIYFIPKVQLDDSIKNFYPNGIFHLRFIKATPDNQ